MGRQQGLRHHTKIREGPSGKPCSLYKYEINSTCELRSRLLVLFSIWLRNPGSRKVIMSGSPGLLEIHLVDHSDPGDLQSNC